MTGRLLNQYRVNIDLTNIITIIGTMGGIEAFRQAITAWRNRKTDARKEDAAADSLEIDNEKKQVSWLEDRITQRDLKIDALYAELRKEQSDKLDEIQKRHEAELSLKDAEHNRCDRSDSDCGRRIPPRLGINRQRIKKDNNEKE